MAAAVTPSTPAAAGLATIATSPSLPPRVRRILGVLFAQMSRDLSGRINQMLVDVEQQLFQLAERAPSNEMQSLHLGSLNSLKQNRDRLLPRFVALMEHELASIREPRAKTPDSPETPRGRQTLTLVEDADMDKDVVLRDISQRHETRAHTALHLLGQRFGVLAGSSAVEVNRWPVGPQALCRALRKATPALEVNLDTQLLLYKAFDHKVMAEYASWLELTNQLLSQQGVLPGLVFAPQRPREKTSSLARPPFEGEPASESARSANGSDGETPGVQRPTSRTLAGQTDSSDGSAAGNAVEPVNAPSPDKGQASGTQWPIWRTPATPTGDNNGSRAGNAKDQFNGLSADDGQPADAQWPIWRTTAAKTGGGDSPAAGNAMNRVQDPSAGNSIAQAGATFASLQQLLGGRREHNRRRGDRPTGPNSGAAAGAAATALSTVDVLNNLRTLQALPISSTPGQQRRTMADVQDSLLRQARLERGPEATLLQEDSDTFELLGMLYNEIEREVHSDGLVGELLMRLQVPVAQAALQDRGFFLSDKHPVRDLLNSVAESGAIWLGDENTDPVLMRKLRDAVDRVVADYQGDEQVFETVNSEVQGHFKAMARKAELAERRHVEAAKGKDRLEVAKRLAEETIEAALAEKEAPKFVQALLSQAWADVLTMNLLRNGEEGKEWRDSVELTERIALITSTRAEAAPEPDEALTSRIEQSLAQVGYHKDESEAIARRLSNAGGEDETTSRTELIEQLKKRQHPGEQASLQTKTVPKPRTAAEQKCHAHLLTLPFGSWFEFVINQQGETGRQRLSWFNPVTDNALFVNQLGQRIGEQTLDSLARLMARDQVRVVTQDKGRLIDRAWQATVKSLRSFTGSGLQGEPA